MKAVIGFSAEGSDRNKGNGNVTRMVESIMTKSGHEFEMVLLTEKVYSGCKGCTKVCWPKDLQT